METNNILLEVAKALNFVIKEFQSNPFNFFYEEDIRATLYCGLKKEITDVVTYGIDPQFSKLNTLYTEGIKANIVKAEYPYAGLGGKFDVAILHKKHDDFYKCPVEVGIEIKLGSKETNMEPVSGFKDNIYNLERYRFNMSGQKKDFTGIALYFYQTTLDDPKDYFEIEKINEVTLEELNFKTNKIYAFIVSKDKLYKISEYKTSIMLG